MKILILNGSPKGNDSVTMQYLYYLQQRHPSHDYRTENVAQRIKAIERGRELFDRIISGVREADAVIWAFPLYILHVHAGLKRFIELIYERGAAEAFAGTYAAAVSSSINFFDHTAQGYIREISDDLKMRFVGSYAAEMHHLLKKETRRRFELFCDGLIDSLSRGDFLPASTPAYPKAPGRYRSEPGREKIESRLHAALVIDSYDAESNLGRMADRFRGTFGGSTDLIDLSHIDIKGGCMGCLKCGFDNLCSYEGRDGFIKMFNEQILKADILIFAFPVKDRFLSAGFKNLMDRSFFRTHQPSLEGKQVGYLISGPLGALRSGREVLEGWMQMHRTNLVGIVSDEFDSAETDRAIDSLTAMAVRSAEAGYIRPQDFLGIGGTRIFRDEIYGALGFVFQADHQYYKRHGFYDFPQRKPHMLALTRFARLLTRILPVRRGFWRHIRGGMTRAFRPLLKDHQR